MSSSRMFVLRSKVTDLWHLQDAPVDSMVLGDLLDLILDEIEDLQRADDLS